MNERIIDKLLNKWSKTLQGVLLDLHYTTPSLVIFVQLQIHGSFQFYRKYFFV